VVGSAGVEPAVLGFPTSEKLWLRAAEVPYFKEAFPSSPPDI